MSYTEEIIRHFDCHECGMRWSVAAFYDRHDTQKTFTYVCPRCGMKETHKDMERSRKELKV